MLDEDPTPTPTTEQGGSTRSTSRPRRRAAGRPAGPPVAVSGDIFAAPGEAAPSAPEAAAEGESSTDAVEGPKAGGTRVTSRAKPTGGRRSRQAPSTAKADSKVDTTDDSKADTADDAEVELEDDLTDELTDDVDSVDPVDEDPEDDAETGAGEVVTPGIGGLLFQAPPAVRAPARRRAAADTEDDDEDDDRSSGGNRGQRQRSERSERDDSSSPADENDSDQDDDSDDEDGGAGKRRRRSRGGRRRRKGGGGQQGSDDDAAQENEDDQSDGAGDDSDDETGGSGTTRRRRSRRRAGDGSGGAGSADDPENTVVRVREGRSAEDEITGVTGSTRLEAKKQRRREGREAGRRRAPIVSESEFLARREAVDREMIVRQHVGSGAGSSAASDTYTQIAVLEDKVLVEHYVARESQTSLIGNVYLGKVQNVLPSMEAAFVDIGAGRNAVLYAGEVDWSTLGNGKARKIEDALTPGQTVLVQVSKDPIGQKGARLTSQISLPGRFLVFVPGGQNNGISRKLPDTERARLKTLLKEVLPEDAGVIVRTAAEGATEEQLTRDVTSLKARWDDIERKVAAGRAPELLYAEPDLVIKVVRDLFNEDFSSLVVEGREAWDNISSYVGHVAHDLADRLTLWEPGEDTASDVFAEYRVDEQIHKALDRKVWLPSGGSLVIDRTEAMTVVDVNTGKFTGSGGNLEETVTKNNLEAAEEIVRQLRLRDIGGIIVIDFIDMVLESNRDLVLRRLVECLGRDRTRHQVAEVTSLGLVQMTRKRIGTGLLESFSTDCDHCKGRGGGGDAEPVEPRKDDGRRRGGRGGRGGQGGQGGSGNGGGQQSKGGATASRADDGDSAKDGGAKRGPAKDSPAKDGAAKDGAATDGAAQDGDAKNDESTSGGATGRRRGGRARQQSAPTDETGADSGATDELAAVDAPTSDAPATEAAAPAPQDDQKAPQDDESVAPPAAEAVSEPGVTDPKASDDAPVLTEEGQAP
ncbi:MAG: Rne/Rng family ribonuclease [Aeromicrobium sp.]|uniref:Rne/Rng family ribonuclease n=1 Tax=Aeromicrobium sp. TaxID=1871063 RepID=UPI00261E7422|nr:Rne/Rng family ribonuclease [Aeromicrobium sp.]MDF1703717.1 Rne/Rng family ribonuclease [Aeromicrobium sp.]